MAIKTIFLDRDGVINKEVGYLHRIEDFIFIDGVFEACLSFKKLDYQIIIISNQSGIGRGYFTLFDYEKLTKWMLNQFSKKNISILDVFFCPHGPKSKCSCRKPKPGMLVDAQNQYNINLEKSWMIGDKEADIEAANLAGINNTILLRSGHLINESNSNAKFIIDSIKQSKEVIKT
ncbi:MAG: D-glycero-beta-D-manno-heptose 1,7-bisphosphate 7-phosphatase [Alphaproteobacteria bacterium]|nr:D-glycero-beta-D-manno-heptose 1,7-bisphosphate 7-phosphatase [Alphaproteobacteria bacterium]